MSKVPELLARGISLGFMVVALIAYVLGIMIDEIWLLNIAITFLCVGEIITRRTLENKIKALTLELEAANDVANTH